MLNVHSDSRGLIIKDLILYSFDSKFDSSVLLTNERVLREASNENTIQYNVQHLSCIESEIFERTKGCSG